MNLKLCVVNYNRIDDRHKDKATTTTTTTAKGRNNKGGYLNRN